MIYLKKHENWRSITFFIVCLFLILSCTPKAPIGKEPVYQEDTTSIKEKGYPRFPFPITTFGQELSEDLLKKWSEEVGATLLSKNEKEWVYTLKSDSIPKIRYILENNKYVAAKISVKSHEIIKDQFFIDFLQKSQYRKLAKGYWFLQTDKYICLDMGNDPNMEDIHLYAAADRVDFRLPFLEFNKRIDRVKMKEWFEKQGYTITDDRSYTYLFKSPDKDFPNGRLDISKQDEYLNNVNIYALNKRILRSPDVDRLLLKYSFQRDNSKGNATTKFYYSKELNVVAIVPFPLFSSADNTGFIQFEAGEATAEQIHITNIEFPCLDFTLTKDEVIAFEQKKGRDYVVMPGKTINVQTKDKFIIVHGYNFDDSDKYISCTSLAKEKAVVLSDDYKNLMKKAGFEYLGERGSGKYAYQKKGDKFVITVLIDTGGTYPFITYRPFFN